MAELRAGGLVIIIRSRFPENVGKTVSLIKLIGFDDSLGGHMWKLTALSGLTGTLYPVKAGDLCTGLDKNLMPINGDDFRNEDQHQKEREHA
ncbi:hypothetical protein P4R16_001027 [Klebsiella oxytoca]|uniref:hypothetical protein n=1 Tax=Klebsiella oxytoca TaxID=571 RepID=UPI0011DE12F5|nr:hypothetical protein [Klebsiella oxytoca]EKT7900138.1 hypothetical protein [Klebsiella oxytoca]TXU75865.1 hypothetical protein D4N05_09145 [Klebsiella oxytoca]